MISSFISEIRIFVKKGNVAIINDKIETIAPANSTIGRRTALDMMSETFPSKVSKECF